MACEIDTRIDRRLGSLRYGSLFNKAEFLLLVAVFARVALGLITVARSITVPFEMDFGEGNVLADAVRVAHGLSAYPCPFVPPYVIQSYGPIPIYVFAFAVKLFGVGFAVPRLLVVLSGVCSAALIGLLARRCGASPLVGVLFGVLYLTRPVVELWLPLLRVDLLGLSLALAGIYVFISWSRWYLSIPFFVAAVFCKATLVAAPLACILYCAQDKQGTKAFRMAGWSLIVGGVSFLYVQRATLGWFGFDVLWVNASHPFKWGVALTLIHRELVDDFLLIAFALSSACFCRRHRELRLSLLYLALSGLVALTVGKSGAANNYFLEWQAALCLCAGLGYQYLRSELDSRHVSAAFFPASLALMLVAGAHKTKPPLAYPECRESNEAARNFPGNRLLSEDVGALLLAGKPLLVYDPFLWNAQVRWSGWPDTEISALVRSRKVDLIILSPVPDEDGRPWPSSVLDAIPANYRLTAQFNCPVGGLFYEPRPHP